MKKFLLSFVLLVMLHAVQAQGAPPSNKEELGEAYAQPTFKEISQTTVLIGGLDINNPKVVQEYAKLAYCDVFLEKFKSDFEWNDLRKQITARVLEKKDMYRLQYEIYGTVKLDRYDFEAQQFPLSKESKMKNVGSMVILESFTGKATSYCEQANGPKGEERKEDVVFPKAANINLNQPLTLEALQMPMDEAEKFLTKLEELGNKDRMVYIRFRFKIMEMGEIKVRESVGTEINQRSNFIGKITGIDFFYDRDMTRWIASAPLAKPKK